MFCKSVNGKSQVISAVLLSMVLFGSSCERRDSGASKGKAQPETSDLNKAVSIGCAKLAEEVESPTEYKLIGAEQIYYEGKFIWRVTFKPTRLLPAKGAVKPIGVGGEVFMNIDLETGETIITYGE
jgi:hypothetical protein